MLRVAAYTRPVVTFVAADTTPDAFTFTEQTDVSPSSTITSAAITVAGINAPATITVSGGSYDINASGSFTTSPGTVNNGDTVRARVTSSASAATAVSATVTIGGVSDAFSATTGGAPSYSPFYMRDFQEGTVGNNLQSFTSSSASRPVQYSNDIAGPFGEAKVAKVGLNTGAFNAFGGQFTDWVTKSRASLIGTDVWIRLYHYFPSAFCSGYSTQGGDGYGATKWLRLGFNSDGSRMTYQLGGFTSASCNVNGPRVTYVSTEGFPDATGGLYYYFGTPGNYQTGEIIGRDAWHALQLQIRFGDLRSNSFMRAWIDDTYLGEPTPLSATLPAGATGWDSLWLGNYWNGGTPSTNSWYVANLIITQETPTTLDSGGRPYISPSTKIADF